MFEEIRPDIFPRECYSWFGSEPPPTLIPQFDGKCFTFHSSLTTEEKIVSLGRGFFELSKGESSLLYKNLSLDHANLSPEQRRKFQATLLMWNNLIIQENRRRSTNRPLYQILNVFSHVLQFQPIDRTNIFSLAPIQILDIAAAGLNRK